MPRAAADPSCGPARCAGDHGGGEGLICDNAPANRGTDNAVRVLASGPDDDGDGPD